MAIKIISVGKNHSSELAAAIENYQKRLRAPFDVEWILLPLSAKNGSESPQNESEAILKRLKPSDYLILLDESGQTLTSPGFSTLLEKQFLSSKQIVIVIGGAYGVGETVKAKADFMWSLSPLVFPHQLVRLMLAEQIYRAQTIAAGQSYHHN